jgi:excisionase family DNA binding protein
MYLTRKEVAAKLGISPATIYNLMKSGELPQPVRWSRTVLRWPLREIEEYEQKALDSRRVIPRQPPKPIGRPRKHPLEQKTDQPALH